jgi:hypothetical protein
VIFYYHVLMTLKTTRIFEIVTFLLLSSGLVSAQTAKPSTPGPAGTGGYRVAVVDGEGALNSVLTKTAREPVVQVSDSMHRPVAGAYVEFDAPSSGPSAAFANGSTHFATTTNSDGLAVGSNLKNNGLPGSFAVSVHVSFQGQSIGEAQIHQTNVSGNVSRHLQQGATSSATNGDAPGNMNLSNNVLGIALGDQFLVNGANTPSNANLLKGTKIQALDKPTTLYLHDHCEYVVGPHSIVSIAPKLVILESGSVRAKHFGDCRVSYGGLYVTGAPNADGVVALNGQNLEVASISGNAEMVNGAGDVIGSIPAGSVSTFGTSTVASGASIGGSAIPFKTALLLTSGVGAALAGLGIATDAVLQPASAATPTSR